MRIFFIIATIFVAAVLAVDEEVLPPLNGYVLLLYVYVYIYVFFLFYFYSMIINDNTLFMRSFMQKCKNARKFYRLSALKIL